MPSLYIILPCLIVWIIPSLIITASVASADEEELKYPRSIYLLIAIFWPIFLGFIAIVTLKDKIFGPSTDDPSD